MILRKAEDLQKRGEWTRSLSYYKRYVKVKDALLEKENSVLLKKLEDKYQAKKQAAEAQLTERKNRELKKANTRLKESLMKIETLRGLIPICPKCKNMRTDEGFWEKVEHFVETHFDASFTHSLCSDCAKKFYKKHSKSIEG
ncbi:hypothetical protein JW890_02315 [candidate division WOR-3 bacterium]|nr:hypothetical protein [candidate division WOR-3 bacterium]